MTYKIGDIFFVKKGSYSLNANSNRIRSMVGQYVKIVGVERLPHKTVYVMNTGQEFSSLKIDDFLRYTNLDFIIMYRDAI